MAVERGSRRGAVRGHAGCFGGGAARSGDRGRRRRSTRRAPSRRPGSPAETIETADGRRIDLGYLGAGRRPVGRRSQPHFAASLDGLTDRPLAAVALEVADDGTRARMVHRGSEPIEVDVSALRIAVLAWQGYYEPAGTWERGPLDLTGGGTVGRAGTWTSRSRTASPPATATRCRSRSTSRCATHDEWRRVGVVRVPVIEPPEASRSVD